MNDSIKPENLHEPIIPMQNRLSCNKGDTDCHIQGSFELLGNIDALLSRQPYGRTDSLDKIDEWVINVSGVDDRVTVLFEEIVILYKQPIANIRLFDALSKKYQDLLQDTGKQSDANELKKAIDKIYTHSSFDVSVIVHDFNSRASATVSFSHKGAEVYNSKPHVWTQHEGPRDFRLNYKIYRYWGMDYLRPLQ